MARRGYDQMHTHLTVNGKDVYVVVEHHHVLLPWSIIRGELDVAPNLITLDHHPDSMPAFNSYRCVTSDGDDNMYEQMLEGLIGKIDWRNKDSIYHAINKLKNDEHIQTATLAGIIRYAFLINLLDSTTPSIEEDNYREQNTANFLRGLLEGEVARPMEKPQRPFTYHSPKDGIFEISSICAVGCTKVPHDDDCTRPHYDQVLESVYLDNQLSIAEEMATSIGLRSVKESPYILDIDLDYFHTDKAANPTDADTFCGLIKNAAAITIATEPDFVNDLKLAGSSITSETLLKSVIEHINKCTR